MGMDDWIGAAAAAVQRTGRTIFRGMEDVLVLDRLLSHCRTRSHIAVAWPEAHLLAWAVKSAANGKNVCPGSWGV